MSNEHTPGPWVWELNEATKRLFLVSRGNGSYVMDFVRYGMQSAIPRFHVEPLMHKANDLAEVVKGREHHKEWYKVIRHPDAQLIASAPELKEALIKMVFLVESHLEKGTLPDGTELFDILQEANSAIEKSSLLS